MRRLGWIAALALGTAGCASSVQDRVQFYTCDGLELYQRGAFAQARDDFQAALVYRPGDPNLLYNLGQCYEHLGDPVKAEQLYNEVLQRAPNHCEARHAQAVLMVRQGRQCDAERMVAEWIQRQPNLATAYAEQGWLLRQTGNLPRAHGSLQVAVELDPTDLRALLELGQFYECIKRPERSLVLYERAVAAHPDSLDARQRLETLCARGVGRPHPD
jgi:tetratricopeptide (TPR) repeat protein